MSCGLRYGHCSQSSPIFENLKAVDIASIDAHADRCERHRWERASGGGKATRLLTGARQSLAKAAFPAAGRQDDSSGKAQRTRSRYIAAPNMKIIIHAVASTVPATW